ncbi:hypothetical protein ABET11_09280 [Priestia megaterium]|uniref:Uncharacterized protein n=1 Tax=Priestia aryabhattai TaxID=412384 RepID=A0A7W3RD33_PRIAR|nr:MULTISPECIES: hypothetical protein [Priestia]MBU8852123.1 hypothetical protein [Bacillus sp. FJAT-26377]MCJ7985670.1 hypothetical protein [Priestia sp. OVL9]MCJ7989639.1 hypothetical protein [Priestia sp. OVS21]UYO23345.1 hypothetical protein LDP77_15370 [Bacillus sp. T_4]MBA9037595.1 hypothetical protein [Priestia aryabhattai]
MKYLHNGGRPMGRLPKDREIQAIKRRVALVLLIIGSFILTGASFSIYWFMMLKI